MKRLEPTAIVAFRQADVGEYLREVGAREGGLICEGFTDMWL